MTCCACFAGCKSDGEKRVDELLVPITEAARILEAPRAEGKTPEQAALELLESRAVAARQAESRLDDVVKTLNTDRKKSLAEYTGRALKDATRSQDSTP